MSCAASKNIYSAGLPELGGEMEGQCRLTGGMMSLLPELVITGGNGGVEGHPGVAFVWLQSVHVELKPALGLSENNSLCWNDKESACFLLINVS